MTGETEQQPDAATESETPLDVLLALAREHGFDAIVGGRIEEGPRRVVVEPIDVVYGDDELQLG